MYRNPDILNILEVTAGVGMVVGRREVGGAGRWRGGGEGGCGGDDGGTGGGDGGSDGGGGVTPAIASSKLMCAARTKSKNPYEATLSQSLAMLHSTAPGARSCGEATIWLTWCNGADGGGEGGGCGEGGGGMAVRSHMYPNTVVGAYVYVGKVTVSTSSDLSAFAVSKYMCVQ